MLYQRNIVTPRLNQRINKEFEFKRRLGAVCEIKPS
jgi:hypothetical protein